MPRVPVLGSMPAVLLKLGSVKMTDRFAIIFEPVAKYVLSTGDEVLLQSARRGGVRIAASCGGQGRCRSCVVRMEGAIPEATQEDRQDFSTEDLAAGWRRACRIRPVGACTVHVPARSAEPVFLDEAATSAPVSVKDPILRADPETGRWLRGGQCVGPIVGGQAFSLAVDLGTTNLAASLIDLQSGAVIAAGTKENAQVVYGADVISRLAQAVTSDQTARELQRVAVAAIGELADALTRWRPERVAEVAVAGNSAMQHLLLGLPLSSLARAPYIPNNFRSVEVPASEVGLKLAPGAYLYVSPNVAGFIGGDHVAALLEIMADPPSGSWALIDIGTNTEISLYAGGRLTSVSCASGPAFEGGMLTCGMQAGPGAIEKVCIRGPALEFDTVKGSDPVGICGSGSLSLVAELRRVGILNQRGRLIAGHPRVRERANQLEFILADETATQGLPLVFTQNDVRAVQLAKAAIRAGLDVLLAEMKMRDDELEHMILAGAFGSHLHLPDAVAIGLLPSLPNERFMQVGNAAAAGVRRLAVCRSARTEATRLAVEARYLELASRKDFQKAFMRRMTL